MNQHTERLFKEFQAEFDNYRNILGATEEDEQELLEELAEHLYEQFPHNHGLLEWWLDFHKGYKNANTGLRMRF